MGEVYKAHDPVLNRFVAIKTVAATLTADAQFRQRFHREAQSAAALSHRNIVTVFEFGEEHGVTYMVMELLEGTDLRTLINHRSAPRLEDKLSIVEQICAGLGYAHPTGARQSPFTPLPERGGDAGGVAGGAASLRGGPGGGHGPGGTGRRDNARGGGQPPHGPRRLRSHGSIAPERREARAPSPGGWC